MYLWRRSADQTWWSENEKKLSTIAGPRLAVIEPSNRKRLQLEVASKSRTELQVLAKQFGGRIEKLPHHWLKRSLRRKIKPLKVGGKQLMIPVGAAFGTGEHATTSMCLRLLEKIMRFWGAHAPSPALFGASPKSLSERSSRSRGRDRQPARYLRSPELVVDLGTGSGILAIAAKRLGARRVIGIDNDPIAISTAEQNARLNRIDGVHFWVGDVRRWKPPPEMDVVTANLFSELLIEILPKIRHAGLLVLSGILRQQERDVRRALTRNRIYVGAVRRRGKWVAIMAGHR